MFRQSWCLAAALMLALVTALQPIAAAQTTALPLEINALLDAYARGDRDAAVSTVARATKPQAQSIRTMLVTFGHSWAHATPTDLSARLLAAASFGLEMEAARVEHGDWLSLTTSQCNPRNTLDWARTVLRARGAADEAERAWYIAAFALTAGVRDWTFVYSPTTPPGPRTRVSGLAFHGLTRFPDDPRFRLARAEALAARYDITDEMEAPREGERTGPVERRAAAPLVAIRDDRSVAARAAEQRAQQEAFVKVELTALTHDARVGSIATMRLGYVHWRLGEYDEAIAVSRQAIENSATSAEHRYIAGMVAAQAAQAAGTFDEAEKLYGETLAMRPDSQSATIGLAALKFFRGDAAAAYELIERSRANRARDDDPWRLLLYGDYPHLAERIVALRTAGAR